MIGRIKNKELESLFFNTADYKLQNPSIGEGTFGKVYIANEIKDNKKVAVKILKTDNGFNGHDQMLLMRESLILHKLKHPCIVEFKGLNFQSFLDPSKLSPSIITEFLSHGSLKSLLDSEKRSLADIDWTPTKKYITLLGIARGMKYLHSRGVVHRDLKPENILTDENYYPRVCDFGLSKFFSESLSNSNKLTMTGQIGTPLYMAPELFEDECHYGPGVDVYAFSMIAFEVVSGEVPFKEFPCISPVSLGMKVSSGKRPKIPGSVPPKMSALIERCWSQEASRRPSFAEIFNELSSDLSMLGDDVDEDEIRDYIDMLDEKEEEQKEEEGSEEKNSDKILKEELKKLKKKCHKLELEQESKEAVHLEETESLKAANDELKKKLESSQSMSDELLRGIGKLWGNAKELNPAEGVSLIKRSSELGSSHAS